MPRPLTQAYFYSPEEYRGKHNNEQEWLGHKEAHSREPAKKHLPPNSSNAIFFFYKYGNWGKEKGSGQTMSYSQRENRA